LTALREVLVFQKAFVAYRATRYADAIASLSKISSGSNIYGMSQGVMANCQVRAGLWKEARETLRRLREACSDDAAFLAYVDHIEAVMAGDLARYRDAIRRYNAAIDDRWVKRNLPLFYPKPHGGLQ